MQVFILFILGTVGLSVLEHRGRVRWRTVVVVCACAVFALAFTSHKLV